MNVTFGKSDSSAAAPRQIRFVHNQGQPPSKRRRINAAYVVPPLFWRPFSPFSPLKMSRIRVLLILDLSPPADVSRADAARHAATASARHARPAPKTATSVWAIPTRISATAPTSLTSPSMRTIQRQSPSRLRRLLRALVPPRPPAPSPTGPPEERTVMPETAIPPHALPPPTPTRDLIALQFNYLWVPLRVSQPP